MTGLREKKKKKNKEKILITAQKLFVEYGYDNVSMGQIAETAEVGTGTLYNYYKNKADIFIEAIQISIDENTQNLIHLEELYEKSEVSEIVIDFLEKYMANVKWFFSKKLLRELISAIAGFAKKKNKIMEKLANEDFKLIEQLTLLIKKLKTIGMLEEDVNEKIMAELVYASFMYEFMMFLYIDEFQQEEMNSNVKNKIRTIFNKY